MVPGRTLLRTPRILPVEARSDGGVLYPVDLERAGAARPVQPSGRRGTAEGQSVKVIVTVSTFSTVMKDVNRWRGGGSMRTSSKELCKSLGYISRDQRLAEARGR